MKNIWSYRAQEVKILMQNAKNYNKSVIDFFQLLLNVSAHWSSVKSI